MEHVLPDEVLRQPKAGFAAPTDYWLANDLTEMTDDLLSDSNIRSRGLFRPETVQKIVQQHRSGTQDWSMQMWQFVTLELWMQGFVDASRSRNNRRAEVAIA
jgi:asparagine synthase (glutamine-hydrolysing)